MLFENQFINIVNKSQRSVEDCWHRRNKNVSEGPPASRYSTVEGQGSEELGRHPEPRYIPPSRRSLTATLLLREYDEVKADVIATLTSTSHICLTTDIWTSNTVVDFHGWYSSCHRRLYPKEFSSGTTDPEISPHSKRHLLLLFAHTFNVNDGLWVISMSNVASKWLTFTIVLSASRLWRKRRFSSTHPIISLCRKEPISGTEHWNAYPRYRAKRSS